MLGRRMVGVSEEGEAGMSFERGEDEVPHPRSGELRRRHWHPAFPIRLEKQAKRARAETESREPRAESRDREPKAKMSSTFAGKRSHWGSGSGSPTVAALSASVPPGESLP